MKLGVFDSGIGGEAIANSLKDAFLDAEIITVNDRIHLPYGDKSAQEIITLTNIAIQPLLKDNCDIIIIACNSATAAAIEWLRNTYPLQKFIGLEPMIKEAAARTQSGTIAVCATPATLASNRYKRLKDLYAQDISCLELDCREWASMIENGSINYQIIREQILPALEMDADIIVLACTHYHWIRDSIERLAEGKAIIIDPSAAVIRRVHQLMASETQQ